MDFKVVLLLVAGFISAASAAIGSSEHRGLLYPHMANNGDTEIVGANKTDSIDDVFRILKRVDTKCRYKLYGTGRTKLFIGTNGYVTFDDGVTDFIPKNLCLAPRPMVAPLWEDNFPQAQDALGSHVWYREERGRKLRNRARDDIQDVFNDPGCSAAGFKPKCLLIVTWQRQKSYCDRNAPGNEPANYYQLVWATDNQDSYAMFNVLKQPWIKCWDFSRSGFSDAEGKCAELDDSGTNKVGKLKTKTNAGKAGRWIHRTDQNSIKKPDCTNLQESPII